MSTFLHYVHCKDALLDCSAPGGEMCESLTWVDEIRKQAIIWTNVYVELCYHMASLGQNQLRQHLYIENGPQHPSVFPHYCKFVPTQRFIFLLIHPHNRDFNYQSIIIMLGDLCSVMVWFLSRLVNNLWIMMTEFWFSLKWLHVLGLASQPIYDRSYSAQFLPLHHIASYAVTPVKYECDTNDLTGAFTRFVNTCIPNKKKKINEWSFRNPFVWSSGLT